MLTELRSSRAAWQLARAAPPGVRVLTYHGIIDRVTDARLERNFHLLSAFREQVRLLRRLPVLPLSALAELATQGARPADSVAIAITFDDGYASTAVAAEVLAEAGIPWTLFVSTGPIDAGTTIWTVELALRILHCDIRGIEANGTHWALESRSQREAAYQSIRTALKGMDATRRIEQMETIRRQQPAGELDRLLDRFPAFRAMSWGQVAEFARSGAEVGSHGVHHELHHANQPEQVRREELSLSRSTIAARSGKPCRYFAFPNGTTMDASSAEARAAGYEMAFTTRPGLVRGDEDPFLFPRVEPGRDLSALSGRLRSVSGSAPAGASRARRTQ